VALTLRTVSWSLDSIITIMASEGTVPEMVGERHTAVRAFEGETAIRAEDKIGKPSAIEKE